MHVGIPACEKVCLVSWACAMILLSWPTYTPSCNFVGQELDMEDER